MEGVRGPLLDLIRHPCLERNASSVIACVRDEVRRREQTCFDTGEDEENATKFGASATGLRSMRDHGSTGLLADLSSLD
jgi:hypothetical protein